MDEVYRVALEAMSMLCGKRAEVFEVEQQGVTVFDDTYNANPDSMRAAIDVVAEQVASNGNTRTVVLGMMGELGRLSGEMHHEVGAHAARQGLQVVSVGVAAAGIAVGARESGAKSVAHFDNYEDAVRWLQDALHAGGAISSRLRSQLQNRPIRLPSALCPFALTCP